MAQNGVLNKHLAIAQSSARARIVNQNRQSTEQAINQSMREAEMNRWRQYLAEHSAKQQRAREDQIQQNIAKKEARDAEQRLREAQIENSRMNMSRMIAIRNRGREEQSDSEETTFYYEGDDEEPKKARKPVKPPAKKSKLDSPDAKEALNKGLSKASRVVPGKTALNVKYRKGIKQGLSNAKVKAQVQPQPDSTTTVIRKNKTGVTLPTKTKIKKGQMEKVRAVALPVN
jgi:hypothetical protein